MSSVDFSHYRELTESVYGDRKWIVAMDVLVPAAAQARTLLDLGASGVLAIGASRGSGDLPEPSEVRQLDLGVAVEGGTMQAIRASQDALADVPAEVRATIDDFDPAREARVIVPHFSTGRPVGRRSVYAARPPEWQALEDKTTVDALWARAGVEHEPVLVVESDLQILREACERIGGEVVLSGDNREGFNGGAEYVRWIRNATHLERAAEFFGAHCDAVRVMPLLDGVPCSIHGIVFDDYVATLRPCEMVVMRDSAAGRFVYASCASFWAPSTARTDQMREVARRVGLYLRETCDYRGVFTVDGVDTRAGFRPTELNPRFGAGMMTLGRGLQECSLYLLNLAIMEGEDLDWRPRELERLIREYADAHPSGGGAQMTSVPIDAMREGGLVFEGEVVREAGPDEVRDATWSLGPSAVGGRCRVDLDPERTPRGPSVVPRVARALRFLGEELELDFPPMEVGPDL